MTGNSTPAEKLRAVFLAALMVGSVFTVGIAFSGTAAASVTNVTATDAAEVGNGVTVTANVSTGETITINNTVDGNVVQSLTVTDNDATDEDGTAGLIQVTLNAGKSDSGSSNVTVTSQDDGTFGSDTYNTTNYRVTTTPDNVTHGDTVTISASVYEFWADGSGNLEDDITLDYSLVYEEDHADGDIETQDEVLAESDTNSGQFSVRRTFDNVDNATDFRNDYPDDNLTATAPQYEVYVDVVSDNGGETSPGGNYGATTPSAANNVGGDGIPTRLDVTASTQDDLVYDASVDVSGDVQNISQGLSQYAIKLNTPTGTVAKTTDTAQDGSYVYTAVFNDAGEWSFGTDEGGFIQYGTLQVDSVEANVSLSTVGENLRNFPEGYNVTVDDPDGNDLDLTAGSNVEGYVAIVGEFTETSINSRNDGQATINTSTAAFNNISVETGTFIRSADTDGDGNVDQIHINTTASGQVDLTATPVGSSVTAQLQNDQNLSDLANITGGVEVTDDAGDTPDSPDYTGSDSESVVAAQPVNVIDPAVEDPQTANPQDGSGNYDVTNAGTTANFTNILTDAGPAIVEVLPLANTSSERIVDGERYGNDANRNLAGMTAYRVSFELRDDQNTEINLTNGFESIDISGAGISGTIANESGSIVVDSDNGNILDAGFVNVDTDTQEEFAFLFRPTKTETDPETIDHRINVANEDPVYVNLSAAGLDIEEFQVDGDTVEEVNGQTTLNLTAVVEAPYDGDAPVNNGRVRLSQTGQTLSAETDARTSNVNDGEYEFTNVDVGPRGIDNDADGIGDEISKLVFTAYQYADANSNQALEQPEVDRAAVERLNLALDEDLEVDYLPSQSSVYTGFDGDNFTVTRGIEYDELAFELTDDGEPVDLTEGLGGVDVPLNNLSSFDGDADGVPDLITLTTPDQNASNIYDTAVVQINFNETASDPVNGTYVIGDLAEVQGDAGIENQTTIDNDNVFAFDSETVDKADQTYDLSIETANRSRATAADEGQFVASNAEIETDVIGVAGTNVENTTDPVNLAHDFVNDALRLPNGTAVGDITTITSSINRTYRVNATATDALGTPLNGSSAESDLVYVKYLEDEEGVVNASVDFVSRSDVASGAPSFTGILGNGSAVDVQNANGTFTFDIQVSTLANVNSFNPSFATHKGNALAPGFSQQTSGPTAARPNVQVYDENGGELPRASDTGNLILAKDIPNNLRLEAFPGDDADFNLPDGIRFELSGPAAQTEVATTTQDVDSFTNTQLATEGFTDGQIAFVTITPTGTGDGIVQLRQPNETAPVVKTVAGDNVVFDVQRSNRELDLSLNPAEPTAEDDVTISASDVSTGDSVESVTIIVEGPEGDSTTIVTDSTGDATLNATFFDESGQYTITTRRAGYGPAETTFRVQAVDDDNPVVGDNPATNLDSDPQLEDVNGDGTGDIFDAITLYNNRNSDAVQDNIDLFDFNGDGAVDLFDAIELYNEISA